MLGHGPTCEASLELLQLKKLLEALSLRCNFKGGRPIAVQGLGGACAERICESGTRPPVMYGL